MLRGVGALAGDQGVGEGVDRGQVGVPTPDSRSAWDIAVNDVISPLGFAVLPFCTPVGVAAATLAGERTRATRVTASAA